MFHLASLKTQVLALSFALLAVAVSPANAETTVSFADSFQAPITQGHWKVDGGFSYFNDHMGFWSFGLTPSAEYFLIDRLSLGMTADLFWSVGGWSYQSLAPSATLYVFAQDRWASFIRGRVGFNHATNDDWSTYGAGGLGFHYFFNEHIAFTPEVEVSGSTFTGTRTQVKGGFSIFF